MGSNRKVENRKTIARLIRECLESQKGEEFILTIVLQKGESENVQKIRA